MNNKGFAISGILYSVLTIFLVLIILLLFNLQNKKTILDQLKLDTIDAVESDNNYQYLLDEINDLKTQIGTSDISSLGDGTLTGSIAAINTNLTPTVTGVTSNGLTFYYIKSGNTVVVLIDGNLSVELTKNTWVEFENMLYNPCFPNDYIVAASDYQDVLLNIRVTKNGSMNIRATQSTLSSGSKVRAHFTYMTAS
jgi:hypothetical protein